MYSTLYRFKEKPFALLSDSRYFYRGNTHKGILDSIHQVIEQRKQLCVLTGEIGTGKTALARYMLDNLDSDVTAGFITSSNFAADELASRILAAFHQSISGGKEEISGVLSDFITAEKLASRNPVLIIDDTHNLSVEGLKALEGFIRECEEKNQGITTIMLGEPPLRETLEQKELESLHQLISRELRLAALTQEETAEYIQYRAGVAGASPELFEAGALVAVHNNTGGIPRTINLFCDSALVYGFVDKSETITEGLVNRVVEDRKNGQLFSALLRAEELAEERIEKKNAEDKVRLDKESERKAEEETRKKAEQEQARLNAEAAVILQKTEEIRRKKAQNASRLHSEKEVQLKKEESAIRDKRPDEQDGKLARRKPVRKSILIAAVLTIVMGLVLVSGNKQEPSKDNYFSMTFSTINSKKTKLKEDQVNGQKSEQDTKRKAEDKSHANALIVKQHESERKAAEWEAKRAEEQIRVRPIKGKQEEMDEKAIMEAEQKK